MRRMASLLVVAAFFSKILGFAREILSAQLIGASFVADAYRGALTAVFLPVAFLQNETVPAILVPMHQQSQKRGDAPRFLASIAVAVTSMALALTVGVEALGERWVEVIVGGFGPEAKALTLDFVRIMALATPASVLLNCLAAGEIAQGVTRLTNIRASLLNLSMIVGLLALYLTGRPGALAWSFACAFNLLAVWGLWTLGRDGMLDADGLKPRKVLAAGGEFLWRLRPLLAFPLADQGQLWIERVLASRIAVGAIASLDYARTLSDTASLLVSQPLGLALLSSRTQGDPRDRIEAIARLVLVLMMPASVFIYFFAPEIVRLVFFRGAFTETGVALTSQALRGICLGLWASTLGWVFLRNLNGEGRNGLATLIVVGAYAANIAVNIATYWLHASAGGDMFALGLGEGVRGFALLCGATMALPNRRKIISLILLGLVPAFAMAMLGWRIQMGLDGALQRVLVGGAACALCVAFGAAILMPELRATTASMLRRLWNLFLNAPVITSRKTPFRSPSD